MASLGYQPELVSADRKAQMGHWRPSAPNDCISLGFGIQAAAMLLPTWIASWLEPRPVVELEDA